MSDDRQANPLVETKLHVPSARRNLVTRLRLQARLAGAGDAKLILVSAPAGFGKTTLVTAWLRTVAEDGAAVAWLSLDERDNDPAVFWAYVLAALESAVPGLGTNARALLASADMPPDTLLATLVNEFHGVDRDVFVVLDDFHVIDHRDIQNGMTYLLDHLSEHVHVVLTSRADPPLPLARLRVRGELVEIRAADLRFTAAEAAEYLNGAMGLELAAADIATLEARTEGWIAARVALADGTVIARTAVFIRPRNVPHPGGLLAGLGVDIDADGWVAVDRDGRTSMPGVWAAGNVVDPRASVIAAAGAAATAAMAINADLVQEDVPRGVHRSLP